MLIILHSITHRRFSLQLNILVNSTYPNTEFRKLTSKTYLQANRPPRWWHVDPGQEGIRYLCGPAAAGRLLLLYHNVSTRLQLHMNVG